MTNSNTDQQVGPFASAAAIYRERGWLGTLPVVGKNGNIPEDFTGQRNGYVTPDDVQVAAWSATRGVDNIAVRLPRDVRVGIFQYDVVVLDVDCWNDKPGEVTLQDAVDAFGPLPPTYYCTARDDGSRKLFFRAPHGRRWKDLGTGVETLWWGHRYAVVWPSVHPDVQEVFRWFVETGPGTELPGPPSPASLSELPERWVDGLSEPYVARGQRGSAGSQRVERWIDPETGDRVDQEAICGGHWEPHGTQRDALIALVRSGWAYNVPAFTLKTMCMIAISNFPELKPGEPWTEEHVDKIVASCTEVPPGKSGEFAGDVVTPEQLALARQLCGVADDAAAASIIDEQVNQAAAQHVIRALGRRFGDEHLRRSTPVDTTDRREDGGSILDEPEAIPALWGDGDRVLWAHGESTMISAHQGTGKTTIAQQAVLHRVGIRSGDFLGLPVKPAVGKVVYLMMDRPHQAKRSFRRMVTEADRALLSERLVVWSGPLPVDPLTGKDALADFVYGLCDDVEDVVVDSVKDLAPGISKDEVGSALNLAWQELIQRGANLLLLHHERKAGQETKRHHTLDDVYGSTWLTSGQGSVIALDGDPGDANVELKQLKAPADMLVLSLRHDHAVGRTTIYEGPTDVRDVLLHAGSEGLTVDEIARQLYGKVGEAERKRVQRALTKLKDLANRKPGGRDESGAKLPDRWFGTAQLVFAQGLEDV